jgi:hypothetical protein
VLNIQLTFANWEIILNAVNSAGKYVHLDLSACTPSTLSAGGGLRSNGDFDPVSSISTGKNKIVGLTLPIAATGIVEGTIGAPTFKHFTLYGNVTGVGVTNIGTYAFYATYSLTSVSFPSATTIGDSAFKGCSLTSVSIPLATTIGNSAFEGCGNLASVSFPSATSIGDSAFKDCSRGGTDVGLTSVSFPSAASIGDSAFYGCYNLTSASFPAATSIGNNAFTYNLWDMYSSHLASISFPASATIGDRAFTGCSSVRFTLTGTGALSSSADGKMLIKNNTELIAYPSVGMGVGGAYADVTLPDITSVGNYAFENCHYLGSISLPAVTSINYSAFEGCNNLTSISFPAATSINYSAFFGIGRLTSVTLGATPPLVGINSFYGYPAYTVTVRIPASAKAAYGVPNLPVTNFNNSDTTDNNWGNAFRGKGWNGTQYQGGTVNTNISLVFETY